MFKPRVENLFDRQKSLTFQYLQIYLEAFKTDWSKKLKLIGRFLAVCSSINSILSRYIQQSEEYFHYFRFYNDLFSEFCQHVFNGWIYYTASCTFRNKLDGFPQDCFFKDYDKLLLLYQSASVFCGLVDSSAGLAIWNPWVRIPPKQVTPFFTNLSLNLPIKHTLFSNNSSFYV